MMPILRCLRIAKNCHFQISSWALKEKVAADIQSVAIFYAFIAFYGALFYICNRQDIRQITPRP